jgi:nucleoside-diphosphate-sugar epimerase
VRSWSVRSIQTGMSGASSTNPAAGVPGGTILVAGACGFIGAYLCRYFASRGASVLAVDGPSGNDWRIRDVPGVRRVKLDLTSWPDVKSALATEQPSVVINCAAYGAYSSQTDAERIYRVNLHAVRYLLEAARELPGLRAFIQAGSSSEYGLNCSAPSEDGPTLPDSDYAASKIAATAVTQLYALKHRVPAWVFRLYSVYGPFEDFSRLVPRLLLSAREQTFPALVNPAISRDFVFVDDVCRAVESLVEKAPSLRPGEIYNIGTGARTTLGDLVSLVRSTFRVAPEPEWGTMPNRSWDHADWYADPRKAKRDLGWSASVPLADGLSSTMRWLDSNPDLISEGQRSSVLPVRS